MNEEYKKMQEASKPFANFLDQLNGDSYSKIQALSKLQEAVWWAEKHLSEGK